MQVSFESPGVCSVVCSQLAVSCGRVWAGCRDLFLSVAPGAAGWSDKLGGTGRPEGAPAAWAGLRDVVRGVGGSW